MVSKICLYRRGLSYEVHAGYQYHRLRQKHRPDSVLKHFMQYRPGDMCISSITMAELEFGVYNSSKPEQNRLALMTFLSGIEVVPFDAVAAMAYGNIQADLTKKCNLIGANHAPILGQTMLI